MGDYYMALPDIKQDYATNKSIEPKVLTAELGDGYKQRAGDGINTMREIWSLSWTNRIYTEIDTLENYFIARGGAESFEWTAPRSTAKLYVCKSWSRTYSNYENDDLTAEFEQVFEF